MGLWDKDVHSSFDGLFDLDDDGKLDPFERGMQLQFMYEDEDSDDSSGEDDDAHLFGDDDDDDDDEDDW